MSISVVSYRHGAHQIFSVSPFPNFVAHIFTFLSYFVFLSIRHLHLWGKVLVSEVCGSWEDLMVSRDLDQLPSMLSGSVIDEILH